MVFKRALQQTDVITHSPYLNFCASIRDDIHVIFKEFQSYSNFEFHVLKAGMLDVLLGTPPCTIEGLVRNNTVYISFDKFLYDNIHEIYRTLLFYLILHEYIHVKNGDSDFLHWCTDEYLVNRGIAGIIEHRCCVETNNLCIKHKAKIESMGYSANLIMSCANLGILFGKKRKTLEELTATEVIGIQEEDYYAERKKIKKKYKK